MRVSVFPAGWKYQENSLSCGILELQHLDVAVIREESEYEK